MGTHQRPLYESGYRCSPRRSEPIANQAGVWLFSEALPQGWLDEGQAALIMRGLSLAQASELPDALMASLLEDSRGFVYAAG